MSTDTANIAGFQLVKQLPTHDSNIEYWIADDAGRSAEVYFVPESQRSRLSGLPNILGFTQCRIVDLETRIAVVMPGVIETPIRMLKTKLSSTDCVGIAWHIADLLSLLHQSGRAHNLLHPDSIGLNEQGQLEIRPALGRFIASDPDSKASAIATDCWQMRQVIEQLGITKRIDPLFALLNRGLQEEFARLRLQPATAIRQSISAVLARHADWENSFVEKMGASWVLNQRNIQESTVIPHRLREMRPTMSVQELRELPDSIDLWGNLFTSSSVDETSSAQALLLEALANRQKTMPQASASNIVLPAQSQLQVNEPIEKLEIDLQGPSSLQIPVQQPVRKKSDLVSIQEIGMEDDVSPALPDEEDYFQGLVAIVEETAENLEAHHQRRRRSLSRKGTAIVSPMIPVMPLLSETVNETDNIRGIVEEYENTNEVFSSDKVSTGVCVAISTDDTDAPSTIASSDLENAHSSEDETEDETTADSSERQNTQVFHDGAEGDVQDVQSPVDEGGKGLLKEESVDLGEAKGSVLVSDSPLDVDGSKEDVVVVSFSDVEPETMDSVEAIAEELILEESLSIEESSIEETVLVATVDTTLPAEKASMQSDASVTDVSNVSNVSSDKTDESIDTNDLEVQKSSEDLVESDVILNNSDLEPSIEQTMVGEISEEESGEDESEDLTGRVSIYNMPLVSIVEEMSEEVSDEGNVEASSGVRLSHDPSGDVQSDEEEIDESEGVNIEFLMDEEPSVPISVERLNAVFEPLDEPSVSTALKETADVHRNTNPSVAHGDGFVANLNPISASMSMSDGELDVEEPLAEIEFPSIEEVHAQDGAFTGTINALFDEEAFGNKTRESSEPSRDVFIPSRSTEKGNVEPKWTGSTAFDNLPNEESALGDEKYALHQVELGDVDAVLGESIRDFSEIERRGSPWGLFLIVSLALIFGIVYLLNPQQEDLSESSPENTTMTGDISAPQTALTTQVQIQTDPAQGHIYIDNVELGVAPLQWEITDGDVFLMCVDWKGTKSNPICRRIPKGDLQSDYTFVRQLTP